MLLGGGLFYQRANAVASVVSLDVNPSIELKVNRSEKVLVCTPLNEDAKAILALSLIHISGVRQAQEEYS